LVIIWALIGIAANQSSNPNIVITAEVSAAISGVAIIAVAVLTILKRI
jgi:hypothetical protein